MILMWSVLIVLVAFSAFFSSSETAILSINRIRLKTEASNGNKQASRVLDLIKKYSQVLTAVLIGNNIVNIAASTIGTMIFTYYFGSAGVGLATLFLTIIILIFGEIIPKSIATERADSIAMKFSGILSFIVWILKPIIFLFDKTRKLINNFMGHKKSPSVTEQELKVIIEEIEDEGVLEDQEGELVRSALDLDETTAEECMTPRVDMISIEVDTDIEKVKNVFLKHRLTRLPVYKKDIDNVIGIINVKDFFHSYLSGEKFKIASLLKKAIFVPPQSNISDLLKRFQEKKIHMAIVIDQYGGVEGLITLEDILEELVGDIYDESDIEIKDIEEIGKNHWRVNPDISVEEMFESINYTPKVCNTDSKTVGGWVIENIEKVPELSDEFVFEDLKITVSETEGKRMVWLDIRLIDNKNQSS